MSKYDTTQLLVFAGMVTVIGLIVTFVMRRLIGQRYKDEHYLFWTAMVFAITGLLFGFWAQYNA